MTIDDLIAKEKITKYKLSQISGIPKSTLNDICSGKVNLKKCSAQTLYLLSNALNCTMEEIYNLDQQNDKHTSLFSEKFASLEPKITENLPRDVSRIKYARENIGRINS